jgi:uncharacterized protein
MNVRLTRINRFLIDAPSSSDGVSVAERLVSEGCLPHYSEYTRLKYKFIPEFGLSELPEESGLISIRGPRQYGKSTWLESSLYETVRKHGATSAFYLNGDTIATFKDLINEIEELLPHYSKDSRVRRLFIDEVTSVNDWERALKFLIDNGSLDTVLVVTTGSRAIDLIRGTERLPGRKGKLHRTAYLYTPISYSQFKKQCESELGDRTLEAYLVSGGSPIALAELASHGAIPNYVQELTRDWILGEFSRGGRDRSAVLPVIDAIVKRGGTPAGQAKIARDAGLANNSVAAGYLQILNDLLCIGISHAWDRSRQTVLRNKPAKFPVINSLILSAFTGTGLGIDSELKAMDGRGRGCIAEWAVAQELYRQRAINGELFPYEIPYWQSSTREIDFVVSPNQFIEVKAGQASATEFSWFHKQFPKEHLTVVSSERFDSGRIRGITLEDFLLGSR